MSEDPSVYMNDVLKLVKHARENGLTDEQIIDRLTSTTTYPERRDLAKRYAEALGMTEADFIMKAGRRG